MKLTSSPSLNLDGIVKPAARFFKRFHTIIFFIIVSAGLFAAIAILLSIITLSSTTATSSSQAINSSFDEETIGRINDLGSGGGSKPGSRPSPFVE